MNLQQRFQSTPGADPIFQAVDGANCPSDDVSTPSAAAAAYSQLLNFGLIRMSLPVPANAEFTIIAITDPTSVRRLQRAARRSTAGPFLPPT